MKNIQGTYFNVGTKYFEYEIDGEIFWVQGDMYYNEEKQQYEHTHYFEDDSEVLIFWPYKD